MKCYTAMGAIGLFALASHAHAGMLPVRWDIHANFSFTTGTIPEGPFANIDQGWEANLSMTIDAFTEVENSVGPLDEPEFRINQSGIYLIHAFNPEDADDEFLFTGNGGDIDGAYLPRNFDSFDSADVVADLPLRRDRGKAADEFFEMRFGFNGPSDLFTPEDPFLLAPNLDDFFGTGFIITFENGARAIGEIDVWDTTFVPTPGTAAFLSIGALATTRRRR